jgi:hypothetical protein
MKPQERFALLRPFARRIGEPFQSQEECITWANNVAPLLNFNPQLHEDFLHNASLIYIPSIPGGTYAMAVNSMMGIVQQGILELTYNLTPKEQLTQPSKKSWHEGAVGKIVITVIGGVIIAIIVVYLTNPQVLGTRTKSPLPASSPQTKTLPEQTESQITQQTNAQTSVTSNNI